jgi:uncharacterized protein with HEPN domain
MMQVWVIHHLQIIGEATRGLSQPFRDRHPEVPWLQIIALRNILVHEYFGLNMLQVWALAEKDLPNLAAQVRSIQLEIQRDPGAAG